MFSKQNDSKWERPKKIPVLILLAQAFYSKTKINLQLTLKSVLLTYSNTNAGVLDCNKNNDNYVIALLN